jgi:hypothetical protein
MRRLTIMTTLTSLALAAAAGLAQAPAKIATFQDHAALMKANAQANGALNKALGSGSYADARTQVMALRQNYRTLDTFWSEKKNDAALKIVRDSANRLDALDKMLATAAPDQAAAQAAVKEFNGASCVPCHKEMRDGDPKSGFKFRDPSILQ